MKGLLVRVGIDQTFGQWNAPVDPGDWSFVYVPIPEDDSQREGLETTYLDLASAVAAWGRTSLPARLSGKHTHLDPDFSCLTYGDDGNRRGQGIAEMAVGDFVVFYAGLRPTRPTLNTLEYALIGQMFVRDVVMAGDVAPEQYHENAHTRRAVMAPSDVILRADPACSGRYARCLPIGSYRDRAYRVLPGLLDSWGGLSCRDGYIQRSAVPPAFNDPDRFLAWLARQAPELLHSNN